MREPQINLVSSLALMGLSIVSLLTVVSGYLQPPQRDEGSAAHIFQLSIVAIIAVAGIFFATADWRQPLRSARWLAFPAVTLTLAFGALYYLEHFR